MKTSKKFDELMEKCLPHLGGKVDGLGEYPTILGEIEALENLQDLNLLDKYLGVILLALEAHKEKLEKTLADPKALEEDERGDWEEVLRLNREFKEKILNK